MEQAKIPERYTLLEEVGQGGMAIVYRATDETLKRVVAIKVLHQHLAAEPESKARLEREAQAVAKLRHENILEIFDYSGLDSQSSYIVTEFIDGQTLKQFLAGRTLRHPEVAALVAMEVCGALAHAHSVGVLHRDVKPENVMVRKDGLLKLMDFGIAQVLDLQRMTVTGQLLGSPAYMAPEIVEGKQLDFRTDVFSVGIMLYLLATGSLPFTGKNPHEVLRRITEGKFTDPRMVGRGVDQALSRIITKALARRPEDRYSDVVLLADELRAYLTDAGLGDTRAELRAFFAGPDAYEAALPKRLAAALTAAATRHLSAKRSAKALEIWNRVLAFDPNNAVVATALRRLEGRARLKLAAILVCSAGLLAAGSWVGVKKLASRARERARAAGRGPSAGLRRASRPAGRTGRRRAAGRARSGARGRRAAARRRHEADRPGPRGRARRARRPFRPSRRCRRSRSPRARSRSGPRPRTSTSTSTASASSATTSTTPRFRSPGRACTTSSSAAPPTAASPNGSRSGPTSRCRPIRSSRAGSSGSRRTWW